MTLQPGQMLSHYRLVEKIGEGGMGVVWKAVDSRLEREVAIKILPEAFAADPDRLARFQREAKLLASLNHPNIAAIHDLEDAGDLRFLVLELVPGESLDEILATAPLPTPLSSTPVVSPGSPGAPSSGGAVVASGPVAGSGEPSAPSTPPRVASPLSVEVALGYASQIALGLESAHDSGIVHRDLKPGNLKVTPEGQVKILDFGLAKAYSTVAGDETSGKTQRDISASPTLTSGGTRHGVILGTAAYMSPEQARGRVVDKRTDIWAFGCVLYEMLTGHRAFSGETATDTMAAILEREPDWTALPRRTPEKIRDLLRRCLEKDSRRRLRDVGDARLELDDAIAGRAWSAPAMAPAAGADGSIDGITTRRSRLLPVLLIGFLAGAAVGLGIWSVMNRTTGSGSGDVAQRLSITVPPHLRMHDFAISPTGDTVVIQAHDASEEDGPWARLYARSLDSYEFRPMQETEWVTTWSISPDGEWVAFLALKGPGSSGAEVRKVRLAGGPAVRLGEFEAGSINTMSWCDDETLLFGTNSEAETRGIIRLPAAGGPSQVAFPAERMELGAVADLQSLPDCRRVLATRAVSGEGGFYFAADLISFETDEAWTLEENAFQATYAPTGHILFTRRETLLAAPFDLAGKQLTGDLLPVMDGLHTSAGWDSGGFSLARNGTLVYRAGGLVAGQRRLSVADRDGRVESLTESLGNYEGSLRVSPDGRKLAVVITDESDLYQVWVRDLARGTLRQLAVPASDCVSPVWSPDGRSLVFEAFTSGRPGRILRWRVEDGGQAETLLETESPGQDAEPESWHPDGRTLAMTVWTASRSRALLLSLDGEEKARPYLPEERDIRKIRFSPDGRWVAYISSRSGRPQAYLRAYPGGEADWMVSADGAATVFWSRDGTELFFQDLRNRLMAVSIQTEPSVSLTAPELLLDGDNLGARGCCSDDDYHVLFQLAPDGKRFVFVEKGEEEKRSGELHVILNWLGELESLLP